MSQEDSGFSDSVETFPNPTEEIYVRTSKGAMRGDLVASSQKERKIRVTWTRDGIGIGNLVTLPTKAELGKPLSLKIETQSGQKTSAHTDPVEIVCRGDKGSFVTYEDLIAKTDAYTESISLPQDIKHEDSEYAAALPPYSHSGEQSFAGNKKEAKCDFPDGDESLGWKVHLNVSPADASAVSEYLEREGYDHKYLSGGAGSEGKAFTLYFGSRAMMMKWASVLSNDLQNYLRRPIANSEETEVGRGLIGRFVAGDARSSEYIQYGEFGIALRKDAVMTVLNTKQGADRWAQVTREEKERLALDGYRSLVAKYGKYFHG